MRDGGDFSRITKKEALIHTREIERLTTLLGGIRAMVRVPELLFVIDVHREATSIHEANILQIPVIAMVDTNCDPRNVDFVIPSNDDAIRAIKLVVGKMADAAVEGRAARKEQEPELPALEMPRAAGEEREMSDEELLGEATLAKITPRPEAVTLDSGLLEEAVEAAAEEIEEVVIDDADVPDALGSTTEEFMDVESESGEIAADDLEGEQ
jgi:small subunit ribosomal protein S2